MEDFQGNNGNKVRRPDNVITEQISQEDINDYEKQLIEATQQSIKELEEQQNEQFNYERILIQEHTHERKRRVELFKEFLLRLQKISSFDKEIREIYEIIQPIIDAYCGQIINHYDLDEITYNKIFDTLRKVRHTDTGITELKKIICKS
jgi:hypothetical protein